MNWIVSNLKLLFIYILVNKPNNKRIFNIKTK